MRLKRIFIFFIFIGLVAGGIFLKHPWKKSSEKTRGLVELNPVVGDIENFISTTGSVLPRNRLEIVPPVNGRIDKIFVQEGQQVKTGDTLALMSSTERAALLDAARGQGEETLKYWQEVYKAIPLTSPIDADVIVSKTQPGQTVTTADAVVVLSDELIVRAQVDETDIGKVKLGQSATVSLDAYPDEKIQAIVKHIYYESKTVNNVTVYEVDLACEKIPVFFRSGMNATVDLLESSKKHVLLVPTEAISAEEGKHFVLLKVSGSPEPVAREIEIGIADSENTEIVSGLTSEDTVMMKSEEYQLPESTTGTNPFMPKMPTRQKNSALKNMPL